MRSLVLSFVSNSLNDAVKKQQIAYFTSNVNEPHGVKRSSDTAQLNYRGGNHTNKLQLVETPRTPVLVTPSRIRNPLAEIINTDPEVDQFAHIAGK